MTPNRQKLLVLAALAVLPAGLTAQDTARVIPRDSTRLVQFVIPRDSMRLVQFGIEPRAKQGKPAENDPADSFEQYLFPPELVMRHQARLKITEAQRNVIVGEITKLQATATQVQWRVGDESEKLTEILKRGTVVEADAIAQVERMIMYETAVKRAQLSMLIRIRNTLTPEQREMLQYLRKSGQ